MENTVPLSSTLTLLQKLPREIRVLILLELSIPVLWYISRKDKNVLKIFEDPIFWTQRLQIRYEKKLDLEDNPPFILYLRYISSNWWVKDRGPVLDMLELENFFTILLQFKEEDSKQQQQQQQKLYALIDNEYILASAKTPIFKAYSFEGAYLKMCHYYNEKRPNLNGFLYNDIGYLLDLFIECSMDMFVEKQPLDFIEFILEEIRLRNLDDIGSDQGLNNIYLREGTIIEN